MSSRLAVQVWSSNAESPPTMRKPDRAKARVPKLSARQPCFVSDRWGIGVFHLFPRLTESGSHIGRSLSHRQHKLLLPAFRLKKVRSAYPIWKKSVDLCVYLLSLFAKYFRGCRVGSGKMKKACPFCGSIDSRSSNEHILPQWLLREYGISKAIVTPTHLSSITGEAISTRKHVLNKLQLGGVCEDCNGGWMSELEASNMRVIKSLADFSMSLAQMSEIEKLLLARWTLKTTITLNLGSNFRKKIDAAEIKHFYSNKETLPPNIIVVAKQAKSTIPFFWTQGLAWIYSGQDTNDDRRLSDLIEYGWKTGFQFRNLFLCAAFNPFDDCHFSLNRESHTILKDTSKWADWYSQKIDSSLSEEKILWDLGIGIWMESNDSFRITHGNPWVEQTSYATNLCDFRLWWYLVIQQSATCVMKMDNTKQARVTNQSSASTSRFSSQLAHWK